MLGDLSASSTTALKVLSSAPSNGKADPTARTQAGPIPERLLNAPERGAQRAAQRLTWGGDLLGDPAAPAQ